MLGLCVSIYRLTQRMRHTFRFTEFKFHIEDGKITLYVTCCVDCGLENVDIFSEIGRLADQTLLMSLKKQSLLSADALLSFR